MRLARILPLLALAAGAAALPPAWEALARRAGKPFESIDAAAGSRVVGADFPKRIEDPAGRAYVLAAPPARVASAVLAGDEILARLVPQERVASITYLADDAGISNVAGHYAAGLVRNRGRLEELIALEPDLLIVATYSDAATVGLLEHAGVPLLRLPDALSHADVAAGVRLLGEALGEQAAAERWIAEMQARIAAVRNAVGGRPRPRVLYYGPAGSTAGRGSLTDETIEMAGGHNVVRDMGLDGHPLISPELAIGLQPEIILLTGWQAGSGPSAEELLLSDPAWRDVPAVANRRIHPIRGAWITSGTPFRIEGVEEVACLLHPEAFAGSGHGC